MTLPQSTEDLTRLCHFLVVAPQFCLRGSALLAPSSDTDVVMLLLAPWISELRLNQAEHQNPRTRGLVPSVKNFEGVSPDFPEETRVVWNRDETVPATK